MASPRSTVDTSSTSRELARKALHAAAAPLAILYAHGLARDRVLAVFGVATVVAVGVEVARCAWPEFARQFERLVGDLLKNQEHTTVTGATWLFGACFALVALLPRDQAVSALWCAIVGDPAATLAGRAWQRRFRGAANRRKSNAGSIACLVVGATGVWAFAHFAPWAAFVVALAATAAERLPLPFDDNATVAVGAGVAAWLVT